MAWYVYIVVTRKGKLYTGISTNPTKRVFTHNNTNKGAKCLCGQKPVVLVWFLKKESKSEALKMEYKIKQMCRFEKIRLVMDNCIISQKEFEKLL
jgi:putative endonuclease